jgi:hypothetical protein
MTSSSERRQILAQVLGVITALIALEQVRTHLLFDFNAAAMGEYTSSVFGTSGGGARIHCTGLEIEPCVQSWVAAGKPPVILWFGNSQLHGVNRYRPGDKTAVMKLHDALAPTGQFLVGYSLPNMTLPEVAVAWQALASKLEIRTVLLPVVLNALRDAAVRDGVRPLLADVETGRKLQRSPVARDLASTLKSDPAAQAAEGRKSLATWVENHLEGKLSAFSALWRDRSAVQALLDYIYFKAWHELAGASAQSKRSLVGLGYEAQIALLSDILKDFAGCGARVIVYVPPYRQDIPGPYIQAEYDRFKVNLSRIASANGADYADLDNLVDGPDWGMVRDPLFRTEDYDFMHFTANGHSRLAEALLAQLNSKPN